MEDATRPASSGSTEAVDHAATEPRDADDFDQETGVSIGGRSSKQVQEAGAGSRCRKKVQEEGAGRRGRCGIHSGHPSRIFHISFDIFHFSFDLDRTIALEQRS